MLYLVPTPIGNMQDMSFRAVEVLSQVDAIYCEDTRHSAPFLKHFEIKKPLYSYHKFNESAQLEKILTELEEGKDFALISDAGMPGIADPGERLVEACAQRNILVTALPGPCALICALAASGLPTCPFQFLGFVPKKQGERKKFLEQISNFAGTSIAYESPKRVVSTLEAIHEHSPDAPCTLARELSKKFEEYIRGTAEQILTQIGERTIKGEIVLLVQGDGGHKKTNWEDMSIEEHLDYTMSQNSLSMKEAIKVVAKERGLPKQSVYKVAHPN